MLLNALIPSPSWKLPGIKGLEILFEILPAPTLPLFAYLDQLYLPICDSPPALYLLKAFYICFPCVYESQQTHPHHTTVSPIV